MNQREHRTCNSLLLFSRECLMSVQQRDWFNEFYEPHHLMELVGE